MVGGPEPHELLEMTEAWEYSKKMSRAVYVCSECGEPILEDDRYFDIYGFKLCPECVKDMEQYA